MNLKNLESSKFVQLFLWTAKAKFTMSMFFMASVLIYLLLGAVNQGSSCSINLPVAIEMIIACFLIGILQQVFLPVGNTSFKGYVFWLVACMLLMLLFGGYFRWFIHFPLVYTVIFYVVFLMALLAMIVNICLEQYLETRRLNKQLEIYQNSDVKYTK